MAVWKVIEAVSVYFILPGLIGASPILFIRIAHSFSEYLKRRKE